MREQLTRVAAATASLLLTAGISHADAPIRPLYALLCSAEMGKIPSFNCLKGELLDITVNGVSQSTAVPTCDKPVQLGLGSDGQCVPFSRLLSINTGKPNVTTLAICRKYHVHSNKGALDPIFDDIALIQHDRVSGRTCFFQSHLEVNLDGTKVPSPSDTTALASKFWMDTGTLGASNTVANIQCTKCHAADPFIWSSYVAQKADLSKWNPLKKYNSNFANLFVGFSKVFHPTNNPCASCHRFGRGPGGYIACSTFVARYSGHLPNATKPNEFLMPPDFGSNAAAWHAAFDVAFAQIQACCINPDVTMCNGRLAND